MARRRWALSIAFTAVLVVAVVGWAVASRARSPGRLAAGARPPDPSTVTAAVQFERLVGTVTVRGEVSAPHTVAVGAPTIESGAGVVTALYVQAGSIVSEGDRLLDISGRPVVVMQGDVPGYRDLRPGSSGDDVGQLQVALVRLGFDPDTDGEFGERTKAAVTAFYSRIGALPARTPGTAQDAAAAEAAVAAARADLDTAIANADRAGRDEDADRRALASRLRAAEAALETAESRQHWTNLSAEARVSQAARRLELLAPDVDAASRAAAEAELENADLALGEAREANALAVEDASRSVEEARAALEGFGPSNEGVQAEAAARASVALESAQAEADRARLLDGPYVPRGEFVFVPVLPARVTGLTVSVGAGVGAGGPALGAEGLVVLSAGEPEVVAEVRPSVAASLRPGAAASIVWEPAAETYEAAVALVSAAVGGEAGWNRVVLRGVGPSARIPERLLGQNVRVTLTTSVSEEPGLVVPVSAVSMSPSGMEVVRVLRGTGAIDTIDVIAGMSANGRIVIEARIPGTLSAGDRVVVGG